VILTGTLRVLALRGQELLLEDLQIVLVVQEQLRVG
jgi:hypothetical protein